MSSRDAILGKIRQTLSGQGSDELRRNAVNNRLSKHPKGTIPARAQLPQNAQIRLFCEQAEAVQTSTKRVKSYAGVPKAIADYLRAHNLPAEFRMGLDKRLNDLPWDKARSLEIKTGPSDGEDIIGVSHAYGGIAETGTLLMLSGKDNPTTVNFLPETHIVVVKANDIDGDYESLWSRVRKKFGRGNMPRTVNWITGPSRSGDIQQTLLLGAHGPRSLHIIVVDD
jgi:L-lactate dehydrogenase complex protein LldG